MRNILAIIGACTVAKWGYQIFRHCVNHQVAVEVSKRRAEQAGFQVPT